MNSNKNKLPLIDRSIVRMLTGVKRIRAIMNAGVGQAYDEGFRAGMIQGAKTHGKKHANKVRKALKKAYEQPNVKTPSKKKN